MTFSDAHVHLDLFSRQEADRLVREALDADVNLMVNAAVDLASSHQSIAVGKRYDETVRAGVGLHPWFVQEASDAKRREVLGLVRRDDVEVISEVGLDFQHNAENRGIQIDFFRRAMDAGIRTDKPMILHVLGAFEEALNLLNEFPSSRGILHCYAGTLRQARAFVQHDFLPSLCNGVFTGPPEVDRDVLVNLNVEDMVIDTDSVPDNGFEPRQAAKIAEVVAKKRGLTAQQVGRTTTHNLRAILGEAN